MTGIIFDIKHFAVHDGPGIRTTLFLKGCPLKCVWCHNPEGISGKPQLSWLQHKCVGCRRCEMECTQKVHRFSAGEHRILRDACTACGKCVKGCSVGALTVYGRTISVDEAMAELLEDADFYGEQGGITLSGGEAVRQADFCAEILKRIKAERIHTAVDTCGFVKKEALDKVIPYTDLFLYDIKAFDEAVHVRCTGVPNGQVLENIQYLNALGKQVEVRIPYVPHHNSDQIEKIAVFLAPLKSVNAVKVLPYHNYAKSKYASLDMADTSPESLPTEDAIEAAKETLRAHGLYVK